MTLTKESLEGYDYQASVTGESTEAYQARRLEEIGITHWHDKQRANEKTRMEKVRLIPDEVIDREYATAIAAKPVEEISK